MDSKRGPSAPLLRPARAAAWRWRRMRRTPPFPGQFGCAAPQQGCDEAGGDAVEAGLQEGLAGEARPRLVRERVEGDERERRHRECHAGGVEEDRCDAPRNAGGSRWLMARWSAAAMPIST